MLNVLEPWGFPTIISAQSLNEHFYEFAEIDYLRNSVKDW